MKTISWCAGVGAGIGLGFAVGACSSNNSSTQPAPDASTQLFQPKPECMGASVVPLAGTSPQIISTLAIGSAGDGFDLNHDGTPDNKLSAIASIAASPLASSFADYSILIPLEFFDAPAVTPDTCVKFAIYIGDYAFDNDNDSAKTAVAGGDCNDNDPNVHPGAAEIPGNLIDDNCDGRADEGSNGSSSTNTVDADGDGFSPAQGDCDDTNPTIHPGAKEICGNGLDEDCDGVADRSTDGSGNVTACSPFDPTSPVTMTLDPNSFDGSGNPLITFKDGTFVQGSNGIELDAGPDEFKVALPLTSSITLDLVITGATIKADVVPGATAGTFTLANGHLGGILDARTMDTIRGLTVSQIGLTPDESLLDATFANALGTLLALPLASKQVTQVYAGCRTPDIDVDGDGLEAFCDSNLNDTVMTVDTCIDGDGTVIMDSTDGSGNVIQCTTAMKDGKFRFVDGISVEFNFATTPLKSLATGSGSGGGGTGSAQ